MKINKPAKQSTATIHHKESQLNEKWKGVKDNVPIHQTQYAFETQEREQSFIKKQFITAEERARYQWYREEWHRRPKESDPGSAPLAVACELVSACDLACPMCYTITDEFNNAITGAKRMLPWPIAKAVIDECAELGVPSLLLSWRGEPTLYKWRHEGKVYRFPDVVAYARQKGILEITAITHGQNISAEMAEAIVDAQPSWISFSIDGVYDNYNKIRTPKKQKNKDYDAFSVVMNNIKQLVDIRNKKGQTRPQLRSNTIYPAVASDPDGYHALLEKAGIDMITVNELLDLRAGHLPEQSFNDNWGCQYPFQRLTVSANGILLPCTGAYQEQSGLVLGRYVNTEPKITHNSDGGVAITDVTPMTLKQAWHCERLEVIRKTHDEGCRHKINPGCRDCSHGAKKLGADRLPAEWDLGTMNWSEEERKG